MPYTIVHFQGPAELTQAVAREFWRFVLQGSEKRTVQTMAVCGGRSASALFDAVVASCPASREWKDYLELFWADERCVQPDHPESNYGLAQSRLLVPLGFPAERIHRIQGEIPPVEGARLASIELDRVLTRCEGKNPQLDLVILSMGEDGHVASLFPDAKPDIADRADSYHALEGPKPPPQRISLGYHALLGARQAWVLASGSSKEAALRRSLTDGLTTPLGRVLCGREQTMVFTELLKAQISPSIPPNREET